jgi:hypothetical protein
MRAMAVAIKCAIGVAVPAMFLACSSNNQDSGAKAITLQLKGDGQTVKLQGSPLDSSYTRSYPVKGVNLMEVTIATSGDITARCRDGVGISDCPDHPFFSKVTHYKGRTYVRVWDLFGTKVASASVCEPDGDAGNCDNLDGGEPPDPPEYPPPGNGGDGGTGDIPDGSNGGPPTCDSDGGSNGPPPPCDAASVAAAQAKFCAAVDAWLHQHNIQYNLDCSKLNGHFDYSHAHPPEVHEDIPCLEEIKTAYDEAHAQLDQCGPDVRAVVINWKSSSRWDLIQHGTCRGSPLVLDLDGDGVNLSSLENGVPFDLFGNGEKVKSAWIGQGDGWLVLDRNQNGKIDGATELFGNVTGGTAHADGFAALRELDSNGDGRVDTKDPAFNDLRVWKDANRDGASSPSELLALPDVGVKAILLAVTRYDGIASWDTHGNQLPLIGQFLKTDGSRGMVADAWVRFQPIK